MRAGTSRALGVACVGLAAWIVGACGSSKQSYSSFDAGVGGDDASVDSGGTPACPTGQELCAGSCVDTTSDPNNCGSCANTCAGGTCCSSTCVADTASCAFVVTGVNPSEGNQNGGDWIKITGNGFGAGLQVLVGTGVAPALALDPHDAIVLTPPAKIGAYDITVSAGAQKSVLPQSFQYVAGSVQLPWTEKPMQFVRGEDPGSRGPAGRARPRRGGHDRAGRSDPRARVRGALHPVDRHGRVGAGEA